MYCRVWKKFRNTGSINKKWGYKYEKYENK